MTLLAANWEDSPPTDEERRRGSLWLLSGIESASWMTRGLRRGLRDGGVTAAIHEVPWQIHYFSLANIFATRRNRRVARELTKRIAAEHREFTDAPIDLMGLSGGAAIALWAAEELPAHVRIRNMVLVQPAITRRFDLTPTLSRIDGRLIHFWSPLDVIVLGFGTTVFGTMDRRHAPAAGLRSLDLSRLAPTLRERVTQVRWTFDAWRRGGHFGEHFSMLRYRWNREFVAPFLCPDA